VSEQTVGSYVLIEKLGEGGMVEVYLAEHKYIARRAAIKFLLRDLSGSADLVARFFAEARAASVIKHPGIVEVLDCDVHEDGRAYIVMELLRGESLRDYIERAGSIGRDEPGALAIFRQIASALAAAHAQEIIHRDLKPDNIMVLQRPGQPDFVKVLDFGVAKVASTRGTGGHTAIGVVVGTPQYMSPEQASGLPVDARSDIYSMGLILYELLAGRPTFDSENPSALVVMQMTEAPPPLEPGPLGGTPPALEELIFSMLAKKIFERPASMEEVVHRLEEAQGAAPVPKSSGKTTRAQPVVDEPELMGSMIRPLAVTLPPRPPVRAPPDGATPLESAPFDELAQEQTEQEQPQDEAPADDEQPRVPSMAVEQLRPSRAPLLVVLAVLVLAGVAALVWFEQREGPAPVAVVVPPPRPVEPPRPVPVADASVAVAPLPPPPPPAKATFTLDSVPHGAEVTEGDVLLGVTPFKLTRELGALVELHVSLKGYVPQVRKLRFEENTEVTLTLEKEKKKERPAGHPPVRPKPRPGEPGDLKDLPDF
jgi:serine/threonine protein kinase